MHTTDTICWVGSTIEIPFLHKQLNLGIFYIPIMMFIIVGTTNSANLLDGLDGLLCSVSIVDFAALAVIAAAAGLGGDLGVCCAAMCGGCMGFWLRNIYPAKMFMGDTGSTFLGYILATSSIQGLFKYYAVVSFAVPFLILGLPIFDTAFAILRRLARGQSPMMPDRGHVHHRLIDMGLSQKQAVAALYVVSSILGVSAVVLTTSGELKAMLLLVALATVAYVGARVIFPREIAETAKRMQDAEAAEAAAKSEKPLEEKNDE